MTPPLAEGQPLGPEWRVEAYVPGARLVLRKDTSGEKARARSALVVALGAAVAAAALVSATPDGMALVTWPVAALLVVVAALAVPAAVRSARRAAFGVTLSATPDGVTAWPLATGALHDVRARPRRCTADEVQGVDVLTAPHPPLVLSMLEVRLSDGARLTGPEVAVPEGAPEPLAPVAEALRVILARKAK